MSATAQPAVIRTIVRGGSSKGDEAQARPRPLVRLITFAALGGLGVLEWGKLTTPAPTARLLGLLGISLALVAVGPFVRRYRKLVAPVITVLALLAALAVCGIPVNWIVHVRVAVTADAIGEGLSALPGIFIPYTGINDSVREVILLGAAVLLLDGAMLLAFAPPALGDLRRAGAALPLVALAVVPTTLVRPSLPYAEGMLLFVVLAAFVWGERVRRDDLTALLVICAVTGAAGMYLGPRLDSHSPWVDYRSFSNSLAPGYVARFNWSQQYGPIARQWPRSGHTVLKVKASTPEYWKTEDLDLFNGTGWATANYNAPDLAHYLPISAIRRWTQTIQMTLTGLKTTDVVVAGDANDPQHLRGVAIEGASLGTWTDTAQLGPGDSYRVKVYAVPQNPPHLAEAGLDYPVAQLRHYLTVFYPVASDIPQEIVSPVFGSGGAPQNISDVVNYPTAASAIEASPYKQAYALAQTLAHDSATPHAFVENVLLYLRSEHGFVYNENTPSSRYPLLNFLFTTRAGYCQHFAGAMALLLRMGGVPARVAVGFTSGKRNGATGTWNVTDKDAHAWVEAWFPGYGWVPFDPTPPSAPEFSGRTFNQPGPTPLGGPLIGKGLNRKGLGIPTGRSGATGPAPAGGSSDAVLFVLGGLLLALIVAALAFTHGPAEPSEEALLAELERALARSGRPVSADVTLSALEDRFGSSSVAAGYVRTLRLARFAGQPALPTPRQRRALRRQMRPSFGILGVLRSLWALPPRWSVRGRRWGARPGA